MSITNLGNQVVSLKFHAPATGAEVNKMLRGIIKPGVYSGGVVSIVGGSGTTARIAPFRAVFNSTDGVDDNKLVNIYTTTDIDLTHTTTSENILYMTYTYNLSQVVYIDFAWRASTAPAVTNEVILCKVTFSGANMVSVDNGERTVGLFDTTSNLYSSTIIGGAKTTSDITIQPTTGVGTTGSNVYIKVGNNGSITALTTLHTGLIGVRMVNPTRTLDVTGTFGVIGSATVSDDSSISGLTIGKGKGAVASNSAIGTSALYTNTTGANNTAIGYIALYTNSTGENNTAMGMSSLYTNSTGTNNTAVGVAALNKNETGVGNTAMGVQALYTNSTGVYNTAIGNYALLTNSTGSYNIAIGVESLNKNETGINNTAMGAQALFSNTGDYNTAIGYSALSTNTTGINNTAIGYDADGSSATVSNEITLGNSSVTTLRCQVTTITAISSDRRDKTEIEALTIGLEFIRKLKPVI